MPDTPTTDLTPPAAAATTTLPAVPRRASARPGALRRSGGAVRRWARDTFSRDQLVSGFKQLMWVAPLTLLIWVYAERAQQDRETVPLTVVARSTNPKVHVTVENPKDGVVQAVLQGSRSRLDDVVGRVGATAPVVINVPFEARTGAVTTASVAEILEPDARFRGLTWQDTPGSTPARIEVYVDTMEDVMLPVQVREQDAARLEAGGVAFTPARVRVRMPGRTATVARSTRNDGQLVAYADLGAMRETSDGGKQALTDVRVSVEGAETAVVQIDPPTVSAVLTLRAAERSYTFKVLPVDLRLRGNVGYEYAVTCDPATLFNVTVLGPPAAIDALKQQDEALKRQDDTLEQQDGDAAVATAGVTAYVTVSKDDVDDERPRKVSFILPEEVRLDPSSAHHTVNVTFTLRPPAAD